MTEEIPANVSVDRAFESANEGLR